MASWLARLFQSLRRQLEASAITAPIAQTLAAVLALTTEALTKDFPHTRIQEALHLSEIMELGPRQIGVPPLSLSVHAFLSAANFVRLEKP